ncbi:MAG: amidohydrolase family protein [Candidatus Sericytochromatia bacterium]|nr:amidohydrolase family protein [Candidatus Sericytochromatia bacterium]
MEPLTRQVAGLCGMHFRDPFSRFLYRSINEYAFQEISRVLEKYTITLLLESMDRSNISHVVVCPIEPFFGTDDVAKSIEGHPGRFSLFASADPANERAVEELEVAIATHKVAGVKINPAKKDSLGEEHRLYEIMAVAQDHTLPVFFHTGSFPFEMDGFDDATTLRPVIAAFPRVSITIAHIGWDQHLAVIEMAEKYLHVSVETSWQPPKVIRTAVDRLGVHRVLMGSDFPLLQQNVALENVLSALSPSEVRAVACRNAQRLLGVSP